jgi:Phosphotransferase enzyme family
MLMQTPPHMDPAFPMMSDALDPQRAAWAFAQVLPPIADLHCAIVRVRVKRGRKVVIGYRLTGTDVDGMAFDQMAMASLWPEGDPALLRELGGTAVQPPFGPSTAALEAIGGKVWFFPNDRKVHAIPALLKGWLGGPEGTIDIVHYVPEQGCTVRLTAGKKCYYGKARADDRGAIAMRVDAAARADGEPSLRLARVVHHDAAQRILWQESVSGHRLDPAVFRADPILWARRVLVVLVDLHRVPPPQDLKILTCLSIAQTFANRAERTILAMPELAHDVENVSEALTSATPGPLPLVLSHCDLHPGNLLWDGKSFAVIDLDTAACAPAALDYGTLIASLIHSGIEANVSDADIKMLVAAFQGVAPHLNWFIAACLIGERLYRCGTRLKSPSVQVRSRLIHIAKVVLEADHA